MPDLVHLQLHVLSTDFNYVGESEATAVDAAREWNRWTNAWSLVHPSELITMLNSGAPLAFTVLWQGENERKIQCPKIRERKDKVNANEIKTNKKTTTD